MERVIEGLRENGVELPPMVFVDRPGDPWQHHAVRAPVEVRRRSVVVLASDAGLVEAIRFEFGGATRLPISSVAMELACIAAAGGPQSGLPAATRGVLESVIEDSDRVEGVGWSRPRFWRAHLGVRSLEDCLTRMAKRLGVAPVIVPGPILLVPDRDRDEVSRQLTVLAADENHSCPFPPIIVPIAPILDALDIKIGQADGDEGPMSSIDPQPVLELPSGRRVGAWSLAQNDPQVGEEWHANPVEITSSGSSWNLVHADGSQETVVDSPVVSDQWVVRIPGWIGDHLRPGSPAGLLVEALATDHVRAERPLWVSNVDAGAVRFLLSMPGPIWVDGPGVPSD